MRHRAEVLGECGIRDSVEASHVGLVPRDDAGHPRWRWRLCLRIAGKIDAHLPEAPCRHVAVCLQDDGAGSIGLEHAGLEIPAGLALAQPRCGVDTHRDKRIQDGGLEARRAVGVDVEPACDRVALDHEQADGPAPFVLDQPVLLEYGVGAGELEAQALPAALHPADNRGVGFCDHLVAMVDVGAVKHSIGHRQQDRTAPERGGDQSLGSSHCSSPNGLGMSSNDATIRLPRLSMDDVLVTQTRSNTVLASTVGMTR